MAASNQQVLLAYTNQVKRSQIKRYLELSGDYHIVEALHGNDAIDKLQCHCFNAIITDIDLEQIDAWRLTRLVRSNILNSPENTPIIIVSTTFSERIAETTTKEIEANAFLPFENYKQLPELLASLLIKENNRILKRKLLVIEDFDDTVQIIKRVLSSRFDIDSANNGECGLALWRQHTYDIVLLDLMLPNMSGRDVLKHIMQEKPDQSVIMMTAFGDAKRASSLLLEGAIDFISKPFRAEQLRRVTSIAAHCDDYLVSNQQYIDSQRALEGEQQRAQITLASIGDGVVTTDANGLITYLNPIAEKLMGWTITDVENTPLRSIFDIYIEYSRKPAINPLYRCLEEQRPIESSGNILFRNRHGKELVIEQSASPIRDKDNGLIGAVMVFRDNTESQKMARQLSFHASHDSLTGLHNREMLDRAIVQVLSDIKSSDDQHTLCHLNINNFKLINDSCGHAAGDKLLQEVAQLLLRETHLPSDTIARLGADEFGILLRGCPIESAPAIAQQIITAIQRYRFTNNDNSYEIGASVGLAAINSEASDLLDINNAAETACRLATEHGGNRHHVFHLEDEEQRQRRQEKQLITQLLNAEKNDHFTLYYQPIAPISHLRNEACSYELLLRLNDPNGGIIPPGQFIGAAERYNMMATIDRWVIRNALQYFAHNPAVFNAAGHFTINLSGQSLTDESCYHYIASLLQDIDTDNGKICFEITETAAIRNVVNASRFISAIRDLGCKFALDDFGSGMSSFAYLKHLPVDFLKIDGMFVKGLIEDQIDLAMVRSINDIGHVLNLKTIAEFVESASILNKLEQLGVDYAQGYHVAKPEPLTNLSNRLNIQSTLRAR